MANLPTSYTLAPANPNLEASSNSGLIAGGNCAPGIGIATDNPDPKAQDWPRITIDPAPGAHIGWGQNSVESGQEDADIPDLKVVDYVGTDFNDTAIFVLSDSAGAPYSTGEIYDVATGAVNVGVKDIPATTWAWGAIPVA